MSGTGGTLAAKTAAQPFFSLQVRPVVQYTTRTTAVAFSGASATAADGREFIVTLGSGGNVAIHFSDSDQPPVVSFPATAVDGYERREISVPVRLTASDTLNRARIAVEGTWDTNLLEWVRFDAAAGYEGGALGDRALPTWQITGRSGMVPAGTVTLGTLVFRALDVVTDLQTQVLVTGGAAESAEGIAAAGIPSASFGVLVKNDPAFDPIHATFAIGSGMAEIESIATVKVSATFDQSMDGSTLVAKIRYDDSLLSVEGVTPHVNGFTLSWSASGGVLSATGTGGTIPTPTEKLDLFTVSFRLAKQQTTRSTDLAFAATPAAKSADGRTYIVDAATGGSVAITWTEKPRYFQGDVNGDGELNGDDIRLMQNLVTGQAAPTADEIRAGDFNGDGKLTIPDYQLLKKYFSDLGIPNR